MLGLFTGIKQRGKARPVLAGDVVINVSRWVQRGAKKKEKKKREPLRGWRGSSEESSHLFWLLQVIAFFPVVSNKIRVGGEQGQNSRQSQEAVSADKKSGLCH